MLSRRIAAVLALAACGSKPSIKYDDYAAEQLAAQCKRLVRCGLFDTADACAAFFKLLPDTSMAAAIAEGKVRYDGEAASDCTSALAAITCDGTSAAARQPPKACTSVFTGTVATGDTCAFDAECASDICLVDSSSCDGTTCCDGACADAGVVAIGGTCKVSAQCVTGAYCTIDQTCAALGQDGDSCFVDAQCDVGLGCDLATNPGLCHVFAAEGAPCTSGCAEIGDTCKAGTCVAVGLPGDPCTTAADCSPDGVCDASGMCADAPDIGMPCVGFCAADAWCDATSGTCKALFADATFCDTNNQCQSDYCQEGEVDTCIEPLVCD
ncbi:MAG TPA: hypothetical protein VLX92_14055 [Kofleriaceae bacterium]|nr:hypothetical protein [Kofleriaceae bacterium]